MKLKIILIGLSIIPIFCFSQNDLKEYLKSVETNNTGIKAVKQKMEAKKVAFKTNISPDNPEVEFGYFPGNTDAIGVKEVLSISQSFEFPTVYTNKLSLSKKQAEIANHYFNKYKLETLLKAKLLYFDLVYHTKQKIELVKRLENTEDLFNAFNKSFDLGNTSILEFNKVKFQLLNAQNKLRINEEKIETQHALLDMYNGGSAFEFSGTSYFQETNYSLDSIINIYLNNSPHLLALNLESDIAENEIKLSKSQWLPDFSIGYESEKILIIESKE